MIGLLLPLLVIGIIVAVVRASRGSEPHADGGVQALRRYLQYAFFLAAVIAGANGLARLVQSALPSPAMAGRTAADLALGLALTVVAVPTAGLLWRMASRRLRADPDERAEAAWGLYVLAAATVSLLVAFGHLVEVGGWLTRIEGYHPDAVAGAVVWAVVWGAHAWLLHHPTLGPSSAFVQRTGLIGSLVGVVALAVGTAMALAYGLGEVYRAIAGPALAGTNPTQTLRAGVVLIVLGAAVWWWHWLREAIAGSRTLAWHVYVMPVAVLGGLLTAVIGAGFTLHLFLQWWFGEPQLTSAAAHFAPLPNMLAAGGVGVALWWYHRAVLGAVSARQRSEPERAYEYLVAGLGLVAAAAGVTVAIMAALQAGVGGTLASADRSGRNALVIALSLLLVGAPLWWVFWHRLQSQVAVAAAAELASPARRAYLFLSIAAAGLTAVISLAVILYTLFRDLLEGTLALSTLHEVRAAVGLVATAGAVSAYHWAVHRRDRAQQPAGEVTTRPREVLLVSPDGRELAAAVAATTGAKVHRLHRLDTADTPIDADNVSAAVLASPHQRVLVTVEEGGAVRVIPFDRD